MALLDQSPRAAIYIRVSDPKQERDGTSLLTQEERARAYCQERGYVVADVYRDVHSGADLFDRPHLSLMREAVRQRTVDVVVAYALDRLTREQAHLGLLVSEMDYAGARLELVTEVFENTPEGKLVQGVKAYAAEIERLKFAERSQRGRRARVERGAMVAGCRPLYGYRWLDDINAAGEIVRRKVRLEINPETGRVAARIFRDVLAGHSLRSIALALTAEGIPTPMGKDRWAASTLNVILTNPTYTGAVASYRYRVEKLPGGKRRVHRRPVAEQVAMPAATMPPLVSAADFEAVQTRLAANKRLATRNNRNPEATLLRAGFARCGYCGHGAQVHSSSRGGVAYKCQGWSKDEHGCPCFSITATHLDALVWAKVEDVLTRPDTIAEQVALLRKRDPVASDVDGIDRRLAVVAQQQQRLSRAVASLDDDDSAAPLLMQLKALAAEKRHLTEERIRLEAQRAGWQAAQDRLDDLAVWCRRVAGNLPSLTYAEKRDLLTALDVRVMLYRTDHEPRWEISMGLDGIVSETGFSSGDNCNGLPLVLRWTDRDAEPVPMAAD